MESKKEIIEAQLCAYIDGDLTEAERVEIEQHLASNPQHRKLMEELRGHAGLLRALPRAKIPGELNETLTGQLERTALLDPHQDETSEGVLSINRWPQITAVAAVLLLALGLGIVVYYVLPTDPQNRGTVAVDDKGLKNARKPIDGTVAGGQPTTAPGRGDSTSYAGKFNVEKDDKSGLNPSQPEPTLESAAKKGLNEYPDAAAVAPTTPMPGQNPSEFYSRGGTGGPAAASATGGRLVEEVLRKNGPVATDKDVVALRAQLGVIGQGNASFNEDKNLYMFVTAPDAAAANGQVKAYFKTNNIQYMDAGDSDLPQAHGQAFGAMVLDPKAGNSPASTDHLAVDVAGSESFRGGAGGETRSRPIVPAPVATANEDKTAAVSEEQSKRGTQAQTVPAKSEAEAVADQLERALAAEGGNNDRSVDGARGMSLRGSRRVAGGTGGAGGGGTADAEDTAGPNLSLQDRNDARRAAKAKPNGATTLATTVAPLQLEKAPAPDVAGQPIAPNVTAGVFREARQPAGGALGKNPAGQGGFILARMNRRQAVELSNVLGREKGQFAELRDPAPSSARSDFAIKQRASGDTDADYAKGLETLNAGRAAGKDGTKLTVDAPKVTEGVAANPADAAPAQRPADAGAAAVADQRAAQGSPAPAKPQDEFPATRWNVPKTTGAVDQKPEDGLRLTPDPMDEPVDVVIVVKDASAAVPVAPALAAPPAGDAAAPASKPASAEPAAK